MKRFFCLICVLVFITSILFSQSAPPRYLPFQGKLYENGQPFSGQKTFSFSINDGGVNWAEIHSDVPVNQGLYTLTLGEITPLPDNLFKSEGMHSLSIFVEGNPLDEVMIYAPVENDPTVQENVKDGVSWLEVENIPPGIDMDETNELQILSISSDTLFISNGNYVILPSDQLGNSIQLGGYDTINQPDVGQIFGNVNITNNTAWQSFKPNTSGNITAIEVDFNNNNINGQIFLNIRPGEGTNQQTINQSIYSASQFPVQSSPIFQTFVLNEPLPVIVGNTYTFEIIKESSVNPNLTFGTDGTSNSYPNGRSSFDPNTDLKFIIHIGLVTEPNFIVHPNGLVQAPSGRIEDKTGLVAFPGEIRMFAGPVDNVPKGWLLCDGSLANKNEYVDLFEAIGNAWGDGNGDLTKFRLPDLRGAFTRGVDNGVNIDPDAASRYSLHSGGNAGDVVGSYQESEVKNHEHNVIRRGGNFGGIADYPLQGTTDDVTPPGFSFGWNKINMGIAPTSSLNYLFADETGGSESRPYNAYVNYIIKY